MIKISCTKADATLLATETLTSGSQGRICRFEFNEDWNGLGKVAVCKAGETKLTVMIVGNQIQIPDECFEEPRVNLIIGVYGTDAERIVIPTIWCAVGLIQLGTDPDITENIGDITPTLAEQVIEAADTALTKSVIAAEAEIGQGVHGPLAPATVTVTRTEVSEGGEQGTTLHFDFENIVGEQGRYASITGQTKAHTYGDTPSLTASGLANVSLTVDFPDAESIAYDESANHTDGSVADALYDNTVAHNNMLTSIGQKEDKSNKVTSISSSSTDTQYPSAKAVNTALGTKENTSNKVSSWSTTPNNTNYPSEKLVKDNLNRIDNELDSLSDQIESEIGRATSAEEGLENDIETEAARAQTAETTLQSNIISEASRASGAESGIQSALDAHKARTDNPHSVTKTQVGLGNVDNTSDANKPISTATQNALNLKANAADLTSHINNHSNPHAVTKAQVGLGNVDNTSDVNKPISTATQTALDEIGEELSSQSTRIANLEALGFSVVNGEINITFETEGETA